RAARDAHVAPDGDFVRLQGCDQGPANLPGDPGGKLGRDDAADVIRLEDFVDRRILLAWRMLNFLLRLLRRLEPLAHCVPPLLRACATSMRARWWHGARCAR